MVARTASAALSLRGVTQRYGAVTAVDDVSLDVAPGEFFALVGPSGSGKTTLLMLVAGFERPQAGTVLIDGRDVGAVPPQDRNIGVVFQNYALFPHMTVEQNVGFPLRMRKMTRAQQAERTAAALDLVRLSNKARQYPAQLSGGQQQRVALARALVFGPPILLLDEPLGALDRALREEMQIELKRIQRELRITVITVTHDQVEAMSLADRIAVMNDGALQQIDTPQRMYTSPATRFIARFVGESSFLRATVGPDARHVVVAGTTIPIAEPATVGEPVELALRPEVVELSATANGAIPCTVTGVIYFGPLWRIAVELADGQSLVVSVPGVTQPFAVGDCAYVSWAANEAVKLPGRGPNRTASPDPKDSSDSKE